MFNKENLWTTISVLAIAVFFFWLFKDYFILLIIFTLCVIFCFYDLEEVIEIGKKIKEDKKLEKEALPLSVYQYVTFSIIDYLTANDFITFSISQEVFISDVQNNTIIRDLGSTVVIRLRENRSCEISDEHIITDISKQFLNSQKRLNLANNNHALHRVVLEKIELKESFVQFVYHDSQFYSDNSNPPNTDDKFYG